MFKKLFITAAAAAAVSVPLAGVASADTGDPNGNGIGQGGLPTKIGDSLSNTVAPNLNPNPGGVGPVTPGSQFSQIAKLPGSTPEAYGPVLTGLFGSHTSTNPDFVLQTTPFGPTPPGLVTKAFTPGCSNGRSAITEQGASTCVP